MRALEAQLRRGLNDLGLPLEAVQVNQLLDYLGLLDKWTRVYNLTALRDPAEMLTHHVLDCLAVIAPLRAHMAECGRRTLPGAASTAPSVRPAFGLLDVGSGAGLPGIVVAICCPEARVDCVDAVAKKVAFIRQAAATLALPNLGALHARVESLTGQYDVISSRAFASLADFVAGSFAALADGGMWLAMKGRYPAEEAVLLPGNVHVFHVEQLTVPGLDAQRCLVWMCKT